MVVIIAEKPSAARKFGSALNGSHGTFDGTTYEICSLLGHVMEMKPPAEQVAPDKVDYYAKWSMDNLPWDMRDLAFAKVPTKSGIDKLKELKEALAGADEAVIATDVDPSGEGELLAWEALEWCKWNGKTSRMYFYDEEAPTIQKAFRERMTLESMEADGDWRKADCRQRWDYMSMQFTRIATVAARARGYRVVVRQGRLKSVMVKLIGDQLKARKEYVRVPYYEARFKDENGNVFSRAADDAERVDEPEKVDLSKFHDSAVVIDSETVKHTAPGALFDLMGMSSILAAQGYDSKKVMDVYQQMYEDRVVSYPRTEDKTMTHEQFNELLGLADKIANVVGVDTALLTHREPRKKHVKDGGAHGANRPGPAVPSSLDEVESKYGRVGRAIYGLLAKNYLSILAPDFEYTQCKAHVADFADFTSTLNVPKSLGFKAIFDADAASKDEEEDKPTASSFGTTASPFVHEGAKKPPQKPTMKWLKTRLEKNNVGTGATRTSILNDIKGKDERALLTEARGVLGLSPLGEVSYALLADSYIADVKMTEKLFEDMERVASGEVDADAIVVAIADAVKHDIKTMQRAAGALPAMSGGAARVEVGTCPLCGKPVVVTKKAFICSSNKYKKNEGGDGFTQVAGCGFKMYASFMGKKLTNAQAGKLLNGAKVAVKGLKSKKGTTYGAYAKLTENANDRGWYAAENAGFIDTKKPKKQRS